jgi:hypothetical protein
MPPYRLTREKWREKQWEWLFFCGSFSYLIFLHPTKCLPEAKLRVQHNVILQRVSINTLTQHAVSFLFRRAIRRQPFA